MCLKNARLIDQIRPVPRLEIVVRRLAVVSMNGYLSFGVSSGGCFCSVSRDQHALLKQNCRQDRFRDTAFPPGKTMKLAMAMQNNVMAVADSRFFASWSRASNRVVTPTMANITVIMIRIFEVVFWLASLACATLLLPLRDGEHDKTGTAVRVSDCPPTHVFLAFYDYINLFELQDLKGFKYLALPENAATSCLVRLSFTWDPRNDVAKESVNCIDKFGFL